VGLSCFVGGGFCWVFWVVGTVTEGLLSGSVWFLMFFVNKSCCSRVVNASGAGSLVFGGGLGLQCVVYQKLFQMRIVR
jgi:hypothetical protein